MNDRSLVMLVHGEPGVGKSWLGDTAPAPRLILDAEGGSRFTPSEKVYWDPMRENPPTGHQAVVVLVRQYDVLLRVYQWLNSGQHEFRSVILDSLTEIQKRCMDNITGVNAATQQDWGTLLRHMEGLIRQFRDLTFHPTRPIEVVLFNTTTSEIQGQKRPNVQGQLKLSLPAFVDVVGYMYVANVNGEAQRLLMTVPYPGFTAKDRTNRLAEAIADPNIERMLEDIYGPSNVG